MFDNAEDPRALAPLLPDGPGQVLITSRDPDWHRVATTVDVHEFDRAESVALLRHLGSLVRRLAAAAEITEWDRLSAHSLRHTGITRVWAKPASWALALSRDSVITIGEIPSDDD